MASPKGIERIEKIEEILETSDFITLKDLSDNLNVSEMTLRRDINSEDAMRIMLVNGIVMKYNNPDNRIDYNINRATQANISPKDALGEYLAGIVEEGDIIALDAGSTTEYIAKKLSAEKNIIVLCYTYNILQSIISRGIENIVFTGGYYHSNTQMFESEEAIDFIKKMRVNKAFISAAGVCLEHGVTAARNYEVKMKRSIMESAVKKYLVFDSSKEGVVQFSSFATLDEFDYIVTNEDLSEHYINEIRDLDVELILI